MGTQRTLQGHSDTQGTWRLGHSSTLGTRALDVHLGTRALKALENLGTQTLGDMRTQRTLRHSFRHLGTLALEAFEAL